MSGNSKDLYFIGLIAPSAIEEPVLGWKLWMREHFGCKVALKSPAHITLIPPFYMEASNEQAVINFLDEFVKGFPPIDIRLDGFGSFSRRVIFVHVEPNPALNNLYDQVSHRFHQVMPDFEPDKRPFQAHITIANRDIPPRAFRDAMQHFREITYADTMHADSVCLLKLEPGKWKIINRSILV